MPHCLGDRLLSEIVLPPTAHSPAKPLHQHSRLDALSTYMNKGVDLPFQPRTSPLCGFLISMQKIHALLGWVTMIERYSPIKVEERNFLRISFWEKKIPISREERQGKRTWVHGSVSVALPPHTLLDASSSSWVQAGHLCHPACRVIKNSFVKRRWFRGTLELWAQGRFLKLFKSFLRGQCVPGGQKVILILCVPNTKA